MPLDVQAKLLRVLQEREFERVGGSETIVVDVRVIAATNRDLAHLAAAGAFRQDLFYRLNVFPLPLPPLRDRVSDIPPLVHYFLRRYATKIGRPVSRVPAATMERLTAYSWPGNVRELENVIERAVILSRGTELEVGPEVLPRHAVEAPAARHEASTPVAAGAPVAAAPYSGDGLALHETQRQHILAVLEKTGWRIEGERGAARALALAEHAARGRCSARHPPSRSLSGGGLQIPIIFETTCFITSSAPPPMAARRESTKARPAGFSYM
jgi:transcriptional regulator with GAF, ATPase, and Fis domain